MQEIYQGDTYANKNPTWHEEDAPWKAKHIETILKSNAIAPTTICEVGCGTGDILLNLSSAFPAAKLSGYEISPHAYERAKVKETEAVRFHFGDLLEEKDLRFDVLVIADVIEHVEDYVKFIKALKPLSQYKVFHIPLDLSVQSVFRAWPIMNLREGVGHLHYFFKDTALATLKDCGYRVVDYRYTASRLELPNQAFSSRVMRLPRRLMYAMNADFAVRLLGGYSLMVLAE
ncbi:class I SAM-dependent methyltransferase [Phreatobacter aquaticus]|uniref:Class I SAM-dependent methyltransferase n=1 Tax=Phreatobacter aquaticus TaxID=2570229 RepID=A0A4D7QS76_9HYPH|nr:class I SAM-dependent methyltransferase [Phreatobacter aquaticus]QCK87817.1 class I SAM-dependent methyltransferase [Phreatobacter aquaticus]